MKNDYIIVSNNSDVIEFLKEHKECFRFLEVKGNIKDVAFISRDLLVEGYMLAADPLAGRRERPTNYLTVIMEKNDNSKEKNGDDILRVEWFVDSYFNNKSYFDNFTEKRGKDFKTIDTSLTVTACNYIMSSI